MADAAGADASREATARSAPHTARDDIVCDTAETRGRENRGRNQILEPGSLPGLFSRNGRKRSSPSRPRAHHTESRARRTRIEADSRAGGGLETPAKHGGGAARSKGAGYDSIPGGDGVSVTLIALSTPVNARTNAHFRRRDVRPRDPHEGEEGKREGTKPSHVADS